MMILGEKFYYMHNHQEAKCEICEIEAVILQPAGVTTVDAETFEVVGVDTIYVVIATIDDETFIATRPITSEIKANWIMSALVNAIEGRKG